MDFQTYTREIYPIKDKVEAMQRDPVKQVMEADFLPCDGIRMINGVLQKVVETREGEFIGVLDLISYTKEDIMALKNESIEEVYTAYMNCIDFEEYDTQQILGVAAAYRRNREKNEERLADV